MSRPIPHLGLGFSLAFHLVLLAASWPGLRAELNEAPMPSRTLEVSLLAPRQAEAAFVKPTALVLPGPGAGLTRQSNRGVPATPVSPIPGADQVDIATQTLSTPAEAASPAAPVMQAPAVSEAALSQRYARLLAERLSQPTDYPRTAALRGWQGLVHVRVTLSRQGQLIHLQIASSSGFAVLDQHALERVREATPLPALTGNSAGESLNLVIPVQYRLERGQA